MSKNKTKKLKLQAQLLDILLDMQDEAERRDEFHNLERIIASFTKTVAFASDKKIKKHFWNDMVEGFEVLLHRAERKDELENIGKILKVAGKLKKL